MKPIIIYSEHIRNQICTLLCNDDLTITARVAEYDDNNQLIEQRECTTTECGDIHAAFKLLDWLNHWGN